MIDVLLNMDHRWIDANVGRVDKLTLNKEKENRCLLLWVIGGSVIERIVRGDHENAWLENLDPTRLYLPTTSLSTQFQTLCALQLWKRKARKASDKMTM
jgi:hypothetical protein